MYEPGFVGTFGDAPGNIATTATTSEPFTATRTGSVRLFLNVTMQDHSANPAGSTLVAL